MNFGNLRIDVGKHRGDRFEYVYDTDPKYCDWIVDTEEFDNDSLNAFFSYIILRSYAESQNLNLNFDNSNNYNQSYRSGNRKSNIPSQINININTN